MDFNTARYNMVEQQIRPWDVLDFDLLDVLSDIPRERFVLTQQQQLAYSDQSLALANGGKMLEPKVMARLIQALKLTLADTVVEIGTGSGYATAVMAKLAGQVMTVDIDAQQQQKAKVVLDDLGYNNIKYKTCDGLAEKLTDTSFSAIYVGGAISYLPAILPEQLAENGRMVAIIGDAPVMRAMLFERQNKQLQETILFETVAPTLHSLAIDQPNSFKF
jgi:protein-L-isoaspartate(D-aspartate) O-methyltransferase